MRARMVSVAKARVSSALRPEIRASAKFELVAVFMSDAKLDGCRRQVNQETGIAKGKRLLNDECLKPILFD